MSQSSMYLQTVLIDKKSPKEGIRNIFNCDADFTENEDYFREDTISLGYKTEADRIVVEEMEALNGKEITEDVIEKILNERLFDSSGYYDDTEIQINQIGDIFVVAFAYTTNV